MVNPAALKSFLEGQVGRNTKISLRSRGNGTLAIEFREEEMSPDDLKDWLKRYLQSYQIRNTPFGFFACNVSQEELLVVTVSGSKEFNPPDSLPSFVTIREIKQSTKMIKRMSQDILFTFSFGGDFLVE